MRVTVAMQQSSDMHNATTLIGTAEAARILEKSHRTIHRMVADGRLTPAMTAPGGFKGTFLFDRADIERLAAA